MSTLCSTRRSLCHEEVWRYNVLFTWGWASKRPGTKIPGLSTELSGLILSRWCWLRSDQTSIHLARRLLWNIQPQLSTLLVSLFFDVNRFQVILKIYSGNDPSNFLFKLFCKTILRQLKLPNCLFYVITLFYWKKLNCVSL